MNQNDAGSPFVRSYASLQKRDVVLGVVSTFRTALAGARTKVEVEAIVSQARDGLQVLQGRWSDRGHFAKSLCQVATAVRRQGWPDVARALLEWALGQRIADPYILNEIAQCHLANDDLIGAEDTLQRARALNLLSEAMYTALLRRYGRAGDTRKARQLLDGAVQDGVAGAFSYTALVAAYGKAGDILQAQEIFERARSRGLLVAAIYTALADAYGKAGHVQESKRVFDEARTYNAIDGRFYTVLMSAYCRIGSLVEARDVFDEALRKGLIDDRTCSVMIGAYVRTGQWLPAWAVLDAAEAAGVAQQSSYGTLLDACYHCGHHLQARRVLARARARGVTIYSKSAASSSKPLFRSGGSHAKPRRWRHDHRDDAVGDGGVGPGAHLRPVPRILRAERRD